jgi:hypothetical protein
LLVVLLLLRSWASSKKQGPLAAAAVAPLSSQDDEWATRFGHGGASRSKERGRCRTEAVISSPSGDKAEAGIHERCGRVAGPAAFVFGPNNFATDLRGSAQIKLNSLFLFFFLFLSLSFACMNLPEFCVRDWFSRGFHRIGVGLHSFCTIDFAFRFIFAYAETADGAECSRDW